MKGPDASRFADDLALIEATQPPVVTISVGDPSPAVKRGHGFGGLVLYDVASLRHARKAIAAGAEA